MERHRAAITEDRRADTSAPVSVYFEGGHGLTPGLTGITTRLYSITTHHDEPVDIVSSRVKAQLLQLLFGLSQPELHLRELVRQSGLSIGTVQQELRRLTRVGLVVARKDGNRVYYRANPDHPVHRDLCALVLKTDGLAGVLRPALETPEISVAFVFGSVARGDTGAVSDVDLMVIGEVGPGAERPHPLAPAKKRISLSLAQPRQSCPPAGRIADVLSWRLKENGPTHKSRAEEECRFH